jgi:hypothetical protein
VHLTTSKNHWYLPILLWVGNCFVVLLLKPHIHQIYSGSRLHAFTENSFWFPIAVGCTCVSIGCMILFYRGVLIWNYFRYGIIILALIYFILSMQDMVADVF